ncbi:hypothetical protein RB595_001724 [Gaeumannomyces hyphopodioides]
MSEKAHIAALQKGTPRPDAVPQRAGRLWTKDDGFWSWEPARGSPQSAVSPGSGGDRTRYSQQSERFTPAVSGAASAKSANTSKSAASAGFKATAGAEESSGSHWGGRGSVCGLIKSAGKRLVPKHSSSGGSRGSGRGGNQKMQQKNQTGGRPRRVSFNPDPITSYFPPDSEPRVIKKEDAGVQVGNELMDIAIDNEMSTRPWKSLGMAARRKLTASALSIGSNISTRVGKAIKKLYQPGRMFRKPKPPPPTPPGVTLAPVDNGLANERRPAPEIDSVFPGGEAERIITPQPVEERSGKRRSRMLDLGRVSEKLLKDETEWLMREADGGIMVAEAAALQGAAGDDKDPTPPPKKPTSQGAAGDDKDPTPSPKKPTSQGAAGPLNEHLAALLAPEVCKRLEAEPAEVEHYIKTISVKQELSPRVRHFNFRIARHEPGAKECPLTAGEAMCAYHGRKTAPVVEESEPTSVEGTTEKSEKQQGPATARGGNYIMLC